MVQKDRIETLKIVNNIKSEERRPMLEVGNHKLRLNTINYLHAVAPF